MVFFKRISYRLWKS